MAAHTLHQRHERVRSATWPPSTPKTQQPQPQPVQPPQLPPPTITITPSEEDAFIDDLSEHPERHFLSPMNADDYWDSDPDSDFDDSDGEWNAGITDFALFSADRQRSVVTGQPLGAEWKSFMEGQGEAFARYVERVRLDEEQDEGVPGLTPDASPDMRDDLEDDEGEGAAIEGEGQEKLIIPWIQVPDYLTVEIKPSHSTTGPNATLIGPNDDLPLFLGISRKYAALKRKVERPGLRHGRTLSGKRHVWRKPGGDMFTVGEDVIGEEEAEKEEGRVGRAVRAG